MATKAKYILFTDSSDIENAIVFSDLLNHQQVAFGLRVNEILGAGFCHIEDGQYVCYGESVTLKVKSNGDKDSKLLNKLMGNDPETMY